MFELLIFFIFLLYGYEGVLFIGIVGLIEII